ncbi:MAG: 30S ribosomal protein S1 [Armatimonadetes bacterium]|jgi:4-hydroxy-3-methylbut-2-enyl diphosphate reductase|nr:30S ribosomal protein S1 [Armatimonadota bacterium]MDI9583209.1 30S ribosomal protein S1 [Acidobacteriota bacterium]
MGFAPDDKDDLFEDGETQASELFSVEKRAADAAPEPEAAPAAETAPEPAPATAPAPAAIPEVVGDMGEEEEGRDDSWATDIGSVPDSFKKGDIVHGTVVSVDKDGVVVDIGAKGEGVIKREEFPGDSGLPAIGDEIDVAVVHVDEERDTIIVSKRRADYERLWNDLEELAKVGGVVEAMVTERVKGGLRVDLGVSGFVPASHVATRNVRNLDSFVGRSLRLRVLEADRERKKVILSHRQLVEEEREQRREETLARLHEGAICEGKVRSVTNYGAFVDLGGIDGLLHVSEMSWTRIDHPSEVVEVGQRVKVVVLEIKDDGDRISLGMRQILPDPWKEAAARLNPGSLVKAKITRLARTGAFAQLNEAGIEGFIPIREMSDKRIGDPSEVLKAGQEVDLKILEIQIPARRMTLSLVAAEQERERQEYRDFMSTQKTAPTTLGDRFGDVLASMKSEMAGDADEAPAEEPSAEAAAEESAPSAPQPADDEPDPV